jgi:hypothetical protein
LSEPERYIGCSAWEEEDICCVVCCLSVSQINTRNDYDDAIMEVTSKLGFVILYCEKMG